MRLVLTEQLGGFAGQQILDPWTHRRCYNDRVISREWALAIKLREI